MTGAVGKGGRDLRLEGRSAQMDALSEALRRLAGGTGQCIVLYGPRYMGKSELLRWLKWQCGEMGIPHSDESLVWGARTGPIIHKTLSAQGRLRRGLSRLPTFLGLGWLRERREARLPPGEARRRRLERLIGRAAAACRKAPQALALEKADKAEEPAELRELLETLQAITSRAPLLAVLEGRGALPSLLRRACPSFMESAQLIGVGALSHEDAVAGARAGLAGMGFAPTAAQLSRIVESGARHPMHMDDWLDGFKGLDKEEAGTRPPTEEEMDEAHKRFKSGRWGVHHYREDDLGRNTELRAAATRLAAAFAGRDRLPADDALDCIQGGLGGIENAGERRVKAEDLLDRLLWLDFIWFPSAGYAEPCFPYFMQQLLEQDEE